MGCSTCGKKSPFYQGVHSTIPVSQPKVTRQTPKPQAIQGVVRAKPKEPIPATPLAQQAPVVTSDTEDKSS